jgi:hypothetical protein
LGKNQVLQKLFDMVDEATDELVQLQQELVRIQSVNSGAPESGNETEVCRLLESGNYGIKWLAENHPEKIRTDWAINEGGGMPLKTIEGQQAYLFPIGEILMIPNITTGFTDSRCVRPLGTEVYGYAPLTPDSDTTRTGVHGINEVMEISNLVFRTKIQMASAFLALQGHMV